MAQEGSAAEQQATGSPEYQLLCSVLDRHRATVLRKAEGLSDADLRRAVVPSGITMLGMIKHLAYVERWWFQRVFAGEEVWFPWTDPDPDADWRIEPTDTTAAIVELYQAEVARSRELVATASPDDMARLPNFTDRSLRRLLVHMIQETARHNGHADIMREQIDGVTGE